MSTQEALLRQVIQEVFVLRVVLMVVIMCSRVSPILKIVLLLSLDAIKGVYIAARMTLADQGLYKGMLASNEYYKKADCMLDTTGYILSLVLVHRHHLLSQGYTHILDVVLGFRLIGVSMFYLKNDPKYMFYFPDLFKELLLLMYVLEWKPSNHIPVVGIALAWVVFKYYQEYQFHIKKSGAVNLSLIVPNAAYYLIFGYLALKKYQKQL